MKGRGQDHKESPCFSSAQPAKERKSPIPGTKSVPPRNINKIHKLVINFSLCMNMYSYEPIESNYESGLNSASFLVVEVGLCTLTFNGYWAGA